jgi:hypothetical protein
VAVWETSLGRSVRAAICDQESALQIFEAERKRGGAPRFVRASLSKRPLGGAVPKPAAVRVKVARRTTHENK